MTAAVVREAGNGLIRLIGFPEVYGLDDWEMREAVSVDTYDWAAASSVKHARVDGQLTVTGAIYDANGNLIRSSERQSHRGRITINPETIGAARPSRIFAGRYIYVGLAIPRFGHFLLEFLSRLWWVDSLSDVSTAHLLLHPYRGVKAPPLEVPEAIRSLLNYFRPDAPTRYLRSSWVAAFIEMLGLRPRQVSIIPFGGAHIENLTVAGPVIAVNGAAHRAFPRIYARLAERVCGDMRPDGRRLYLSRTRLPHDKRRAVNEGELEALLAEQGFQIVHPERLPLVEQIRLIRNADVVAGCGGSAMHMLCFARPGTRALVLDARAVNNQFAIEQVCGVRATHLWMGSNQPFQGPSEWTIDLDMVRCHLPGVTDPAV